MQSSEKDVDCLQYNLKRHYFGGKQERRRKNKKQKKKNHSPTELPATALNESWRLINFFQIWELPIVLGCLKISPTAFSLITNMLLTGPLYYVQRIVLGVFSLRERESK